MVQYHLAYYTFWAARYYLATKHKFTCQKLKAHLEELICIYGLNQLMKDSAPLYDCGYFTEGSGELVIQALKTKISNMRP